MVKVLCKRGPGYWIKKPYTAEEERANVLASSKA